MSEVLRKWLSKRTDRLLRTVQFCEGCGQVCDGACRGAVIYERSRDQALSVIGPR